MGGEESFDQGCSSHMLLMHRSHGRQYCLGYCSDMITEVASNIGHPSLYCRRTVIKSWGHVVSILFLSRRMNE